jgi:hypothetical protein
MHHLNGQKIYKREKTWRHPTVYINNNHVAQKINFSLWYMAPCCGIIQAYRNNIRLYGRVFALIDFNAWYVVISIFRLV